MQVANTERKRSDVDADVSDLFFNLDHSASTVYVDKNFSHYDEAKLTEEAGWFCHAILNIGGPHYSPSEIIADFYARI